MKIVCSNSEWIEREHFVVYLQAEVLEVDLGTERNVQTEYFAGLAIEMQYLREEHASFVMVALVSTDSQQFRLAGLRSKCE